jgi:hypothetical protein
MSHDRIYAIISALAEYVRSPSLRHLRDPHNLQKLAKEVVTVFDRAGSVWTKWDGRRDDVAKAAAQCWIPIEDLLAFLNTLPGPPLTLTDVKQRLRALWEEPYSAYPNDELQAGCLAIYETEKAAGTEMSAGPVTVLCRSFDHLLCSKGDEPWVQAGRMNFAKKRCE